MDAVVTVWQREQDQSCAKHRFGKGVLFGKSFEAMAVSHDVKSVYMAIITPFGEGFGSLQLAQIAADDGDLSQRRRKAIVVSCVFHTA